MARPEVREAIFVASPDLDAAVDVWLSDPLSDQGGRAERAVVRYVARMCTRPTPFGLFAGCSLGDVGAYTEVRLCGIGAVRRSTRLDMEYVASLVAELERTPQVRARLTYRPNSSLYTAAGRVRYVEALLRDRTRRHRLVAVESSEPLLETLARAADGATVDALAQALVDDDISIDDATAFIEELIDAQLLVSDLEPPLTGADPVRSLIERLGGDAGESSAATAARVLGAVAARLQSLDAQPPGAPTTIYTDSADMLRTLPARVDMPRLFQVDLTRPVDTATLGPEVIRELEAAARILHALSPVRRGTALDQFRDRFRARYEDAEVPLEQVLDEEVGIGFDPSQAPAAEASPLLDGLTFPGDADATVPWSRTMTFLTGRLATALREGAQEISITAQDAEGLAAPNLPPLPDAFAVTAALAAPSTEAFRSGDFRVLVHSVAGPSGARMLGRFCHTDPELEARVRDHLQREAALQPDAVLAEIVHLPEGRVGNILHRPVLRDYEIPYLGHSGAPEERQVPVSDLLVSVRGDRVVLRSLRLDRELVPRMSTAHNFAARSIGVYRFLCSLQDQGVNGVLGFDWGVLVTSPFLPRVVSGRLVLSRARWRLTKGDIALLQHKDRHARYVAMQAARARLRLPRLVALSDADNELVVDLDNPLMVETLVHLVRQRSEAALVEVFPAPDELWITGPEGRFAGEVIVPFEKRAPAASPPAMPAPPQPAAASAPTAGDTPHLPGSDWLFLKLYCGTSTADALLRELVAPLVRDAQAMGQADRWFFLRYADPDWHLRLRLHGDPSALAALLVDTRTRIEPLLRDATVSRLAVDTYKPEADRYGGDAAMPVVEAMFQADSECVLDIVAMLSGDEGMDARWRLALRGTDMLLDDLGLSWDEKRAVMRSLRDGYRAEHRADNALRKQVGDRYRREAAALTALVRKQGDAESPLAPGLDALAARSHHMAPPAARLHALASDEMLTRPIPEIARSLVHMHCNRLLRSATRAQEMVIYDFLDRIYTSMAERR